MAGFSSTRWKQESLQAIFIVMEASWLTAIFLVFENWVPPTGQLSLAWASVLYPAAYVLARMTRYGNWRRKRETAFMTALAISALALAVILLLPFDPLSPGDDSPLSVKRLIIILAGGGFVWSRAWLLAHKQLDLPNFAFSFQLGIYVLLVVALFSGFIQLPRSAVANLMIVFFITGLVGLWFARTRQPNGPAGASTLPPWLIMVTAALGLVLLASLLAQAMVDRGLLELALQGIAWVGRQFARLFAYLMSLLPSSSPMEVPANPMPIPGGAANGEVSKRYLLFVEWRRKIAEIVFTASWATLFAMLLFQNMRRLMQWLLRKAGTQGVSFEASDIGFFDDIMIMLRTLLGWLLRLFRTLKRRPRGGKRRSPEVESIREIYRRLLAWTAARGRPHVPAQTPYEYLEALIPWLPEKEADLRTLTESYVLARYGPDVPDAVRLRTMKECWGRIKGAKRGKEKKTKKEANVSAARNV